MTKKSLAARRNASVALSVAALLTAGIGSSAAPSAGATDAAESASPVGSTAEPALDKGYYDARAAATDDDQQARAAAAAKASARPATSKLREGLGNEAVVDLDGLTGTVRYLARLDGFLTGPSSQSARAIAMTYVRANAAALGLKRADLAGLRLRRDYVDVAGTHHLSWTQWAGGVELFGNGLRANVTEDGRLINLSGSPVSGLDAPAVGPTEVGSAKAAIGAARADVGDSRVAGPDDSARQVLFLTAEGVRRGWEAITMSADRPTLSVIDAESGRTLFRQDLRSEVAGKPDIRTPVPAGAVDDAATATPSGTDEVAKKPRRAPKAAKGLAFEYFPKAKHGGRAELVNFSRKGWLKARAAKLAGNNSYTWSDVNDDDRVNKGEDIRPRTPGSWNYRLKPFDMDRYSFCDNPWPCSWNPNKPYSWRVNRAQNGTQVFYFVNNWHDWLLKKPIGFNEAAGNFEKVNRSGKGKGGDAVRTQTIDGANSDGAGLPDGSHVDNANMATPPDGKAPTMQLYLQHAPGTVYPRNGVACTMREDERGCDPWSPTNVGDEADTVYHEYLHGVSNRLVVDASGRSTLGGGQAGAMGEAWGDWYAMDYLEVKGLEVDRPAKPDVWMFQYDGAGTYLDRYQPIDCNVGEEVPACDPLDELDGSGGYTYADYGQIWTGPEVHTDGEIWTQTLWDLREEVGSRAARALVTRAMEVAAENPSFIDMRNAILLSDNVIYGGSHHDAIWAVFANRGMGYHAGSLGGDDSTPAAAFDLPPTGPEVPGIIRGTVTDSATGDPVEGLTVTLAFQGQPGVGAPSAVTDANGEWQIEAPPGEYPKLAFSGAGYETVLIAVEVVSDDTSQYDQEVERNWASRSGGASTSEREGVNYGFGCNWNSLIDQNDTTGWASTSDLNRNGNPTAATPKKVVVNLPQPVDIDRITLNPSNTCGDGISASTGEWRLEISTDGGATWFSDSGGVLTVADLNRQNEITVPNDAIAVDAIRFTMVQPMALMDEAEFPGACSEFAWSGCAYLDSTELRVFGAATP